MTKNKIRLCVVTSSLKGIYDLIKAQSLLYETHLIYIDYPTVQCDTSDFSYSYPVRYKLDSVFLAEVAYWKSLTVLPTLLNIYRQIKTVIKKNEIDIIHAHWSIPSAFISAVATRDIPLVTTLRGLDARLQARQIIFQPFVTYALKRSSNIIALSNKLKDEAIGLGVDSKKISIIPVGIDQNRFKPLNKSEVRKELNLSNAEFIILFVGNLIKLKGVDRLIKMCSLLNNEVKYRLIILGDGPEKDNLCQLAYSLGMESKVDFKGEIPPGKIPSYMSASDVLVLLSQSEGLPACVQEAMSCGIPVIASNVGGLPDIIEHGVNGFLVTNDDEALGYLRQIISSPELAHKLGQSSFLFSRHKLSLEKVLQNTDEIYRSLLQ